MGRTKIPDNKKVRSDRACQMCKGRKRKVRRTMSEGSGRPSSSLVREPPPVATVPSQYLNVFDGLLPECDAAEPCESCIQRKEICKYPDEHAMDPDAESQQKFNAVRGQPASTRSGETSTERNVAGASSGPSWNSNSIVTPRSGPRNGGNPSEPFSSPTNIRSRMNGGSPSSEDDASLQKSPAPEEVVEFWGESRWLQTPERSLLYMGKASTYAFLQAMRTEIGVSHLAGSDCAKAFTEEPGRHVIPESKLEQIEGEIPCGLPDGIIAIPLAGCFFTGTSGFVEIVDRQEFDRSLHSALEDPRSVCKSSLSLIYLVLANGLAMALPKKIDNSLAMIVTDTRDHADLFFRSGIRLAEGAPGYYEGDLWSIQARALMALYNFSVSKWRPAYIMLSPAVRTAYTLGFHVEDFSQVEKDESRLELRLHLMRSLFVLDMCISEALDLPKAMEEKNVYKDITELRPQSAMRHDGIMSPHQLALDGTIQASWAMNEIIKSYRDKGSVTTSLGLETLRKCRERSAALSPDLDFFSSVQERHLSVDDHIAIFHVNVLEAYCKLLATRPFFGGLLVDLLRSPSAVSTEDPTPRDDLAQTCLKTSISLVSMVHLAYRSSWLPHRHGFLPNYFFAAVQIIMANEVVNMFENENYGEIEGIIIAIARHFASPDAQGQSVWATLSTIPKFARERRGARGVSDVNPWGGDFTTDFFPASANRSLPLRTVQFADPTVVPCPNAESYPTGGSGSEAGGSSMMGSPAMHFPFDHSNERYDMAFLRSESDSSFVIIPPHHEIPQSGAPVSSEPYIFPSALTAVTQMNFGYHGSSGDHYPVPWAHGSSGYQLPPPAVTPMSEQYFGPQSEQYDLSKEEYE